VPREADEPSPFVVAQRDRLLATRALAPALEALLAPGGLLVYETFTERQRELGHGPGNPAFLLTVGELPALFPGLQPLASIEGLVASGSRRDWLAGLVARKQA
jgi:hypothetical protein